MSTISIDGTRRSVLHERQHLVRLNRQACIMQIYTRIQFCTTSPSPMISMRGKSVDSCSKEDPSKSVEISNACIEHCERDRSGGRDSPGCSYIRGPQYYTRVVFGFMHMVVVL